MDKKREAFHHKVAEKLIEQLEQGVAPWQKPWQSTEFLPYNASTGQRFRGVNVLQLMSEGRSDARWMTYNQAQAIGAQVKKGEKGTVVQYWKYEEERVKRDEQGNPLKDKDGKSIKESVRLQRGRVFQAVVFNAEQIEGLPPPPPKPELSWNPLERAEQILAASGATIKHAPGNRAFYRPSDDSITLPEKAQFPSADGYYATALHELGHWTGHESRLARDIKHPFGSTAYAKEELRAEIASMMLGQELGIGHDPSQHASYVGSWIKVLKDDPQEIYRAASDAEKIQSFVLALEHKQELTQEQEQQQEEEPVQSEQQETLQPKVQVSLEERPFELPAPETVQQDNDARLAQLLAIYSGQKMQAMREMAETVQQQGWEAYLPPNWTGELQIVASVVDADGQIQSIDDSGREPTGYFIYARQGDVPADENEWQRFAGTKTREEAEARVEEILLVDAMAASNPYDQAAALASIERSRVARNPNATDEERVEAKQREDSDFFLAEQYEAQQQSTENTSTTLQQDAPTKPAAAEPQVDSDPLSDSDFKAAQGLWNKLHSGSYGGRIPLSKNAGLGLLKAPSTKDWHELSAVAQQGLARYHKERIEPAGQLWDKLSGPQRSHINDKQGTVAYYSWDELLQRRSEPGAVEIPRLTEKVLQAQATQGIDPKDGLSAPERDALALRYLPADHERLAQKPDSTAISGWQPAEAEGFYTNAHIIDCGGSPPHLSDWQAQQNAEAVTVPLHAIKAFHKQQQRRSSRDDYVPLQILAEDRANNRVLLEGEGMRNPVQINADYLGYFLSKYPGAEFKAQAADRYAPTTYIHHQGQLVGAIEPLQIRNAHTSAQIHSAMESVQQVQQSAKTQVQQEQEQPQPPQTTETPALVAEPPADEIHAPEPPSQKQVNQTKMAQLLAAYPEETTGRLRQAAYALQKDGLDSQPVFGQTLPPDWTGEIKVLPSVRDIETGQISPAEQSGRAPEGYAVYAKRGEVKTGESEWQPIVACKTLEQAEIRAEQLQLLDVLMTQNPAEQAAKLAQIEQAQRARQGATHTAKAEGQAPQQVAAERHYLKTDWNDREEVKALGAKWDAQEKLWYVPQGMDAAPFAKWPRTTPEQVKAEKAETAQKTQQRSAPPRKAAREAPAERQYLAVPIEQKDEAKALGARWDAEQKLWYAEPKADMGKLAKFLPGNIQVQQEMPTRVQDEFAAAMRSMGLVVEKGHPIMDSKPHRVPVEGGKKGATDGFYIGHLNGKPAGYISNNRTGAQITWKSQATVLTDEQKAKVIAESAQERARRAAERSEMHEQAAERVSKQLQGLQPVSKSQPTPYLQTKGVAATEGVMTDKNGKTTFIPAYDESGKHWTTQYVQEDGNKRFAKGGKLEGSFHPVGGMEALKAAPVLVIAEGYATAASLAEGLGHATVAAFTASNLHDVAQALHAKYPNKPIVIAGDDDKQQETQNGRNPGREKAIAAAKAVDGSAVFPIFAPGEQQGNPKGFTDFNDLDKKSALGRDGLERQIKSAVLQEQRHHQQRREQQQKFAAKQEEGMKI